MTVGELAAKLLALPDQNEQVYVYEQDGDNDITNVTDIIPGYVHKDEYFYYANGDVCIVETGPLTLIC